MSANVKLQKIKKFRRPEGSVYLKPLRSHSLAAMDLNEDLITKARVNCRNEKVREGRVVLILTVMWQAWQWGSSLYNYLNSVQVEGERGCSQYRL